MSLVNITQIRESSGGHTRYDFEINPKDSGKQNEIFRQGMLIELEIASGTFTEHHQSTGGGENAQKQK